jgi:hypothetical protein
MPKKGGKVLLKATICNESLHEINNGNGVRVANHSVQNLPSSRLLAKNVKIRIYKSTSLLWFCMGEKLGL